MPNDIESFLRKYSPDIARLGTASRTKMRKALPRWTEFVYDNYNALVFGFSPTERPSDAVFSIALYPKWVRVFFLDGVSLDDPQGRLSGSGWRVRSVRLEKASDLDDPAIRALMKQAMRDAPKASGRGGTMVRTVSATQRPRRPATRPRPSGR